MVVICLGPVCVPVWPLVFFALMPVWNALPEKYQTMLKAFFFDTIYPTFIAWWFEKLPKPMQKMLTYGVPKDKERKASTQSQTATANETVDAGGSG